MSQCLHVGKNYVQIVVDCLSLQVAKIHAKNKKIYLH
jgi:hypothetical protein